MIGCSFLSQCRNRNIKVTFMIGNQSAAAACGNDFFHTACNQLFHPQLGVKTLLDGGRRRTKNLYGVVKRTVPAGQVRQ